MDNLETVLYFDWRQTAIALFALISFGIAMYEVWKKIKSIFGIEFKKDRERREEHELLVKTSNNLIALQSKHDKDEKDLKKCLLSFIDETRKENAQLRAAINKQEENNLVYREVSRGIREDLANSVKALADSQKDRDAQIEALMCGSKELLGSTIDQLYSKYVALEGIPESEVDEFNDIFAAYKQLKGNHRRDAKYLYVKEHLPVLPVETKLK